MMKKLSPTFIIICIYNLLSGVEYAVILPTLNLYLIQLHAPSFFIGIVMSAFSLSGILAAPIFGHITDRTRSTKGAVIVSNIFEIVDFEKTSNDNAETPEDITCGTERSDNESSVQENISTQSGNENEEIVNDENRSIEAPYSFWAYVYNDLLREEVVVCLALMFVLMFAQSGTETLVTPLTYKLFNWKEFRNSIFFLVSGIIYILSLWSLAAISKKVSDRILLIIGLSVLVANFSIYFVFTIFAVKEPIGTLWTVVVYCIYSAVWIFTFAYAWIPQSSLFSKLTAERTQGFNQGVRLVIMGIGQVLGPIWVGYTVNYLTVMAGMFLVLLTIVYIMVLISNKRLDLNNHSRRRSSETMPLIAPSNG